MADSSTSAATLAQLRAFLAAYDRGSFTRAAEALGMSQAGVSELVGRLEVELAAPLFVRGRPLVPTAAAEEFRVHAAASVAAAEDGVSAVRALQSLEGGVCTFGVLRNAPYYDLADLVERFHERHPNVRVRLVGVNSAFVADSIATGELEAGLIALPVAASLRFRPLLREEVFFASANRHEDGPVAIAELASARLALYDAHAGWRDPVRRQLRERAAAAGLAIDPAIEVEHVEAALPLVASGAADTVVGRAVASASTFPASIRTFPLDPPLYETVAIATRDGASLSPATRRLVDLVVETLTSREAPDGGRARHVSAGPGPSLRRAVRGGDGMARSGR